MQIVPLSGPRNYKRLWLYRRQAEAEYVLALSTSMRDVIYFMNLINEMKKFGINLPPVPKPNTTCRVFEDNVGALELANTPKVQPRTKHLAVHTTTSLPTIYLRQDYYCRESGNCLSES